MSSGALSMTPVPNQLLSVNCNVNATDSSHPTSSPSPGVILGSTPLSQIGVHSLPVTATEVNALHGISSFYYYFNLIKLINANR